MTPYLSHPVRRIRDDPISDESVALVVELESTTPETFASAIESLSGTIEQELQFDSYLIELPQSAVEDLCAQDGLTKIETAQTLSLTETVDDDVADRRDDDR